MHSNLFVLIVFKKKSVKIKYCGANLSIFTSKLVPQVSYPEMETESKCNTESHTE